MKRIYPILLILFLPFISKSQDFGVGAIVGMVVDEIKPTVVTRDPGWVAEDQLRLEETAVQNALVHEEMVKNVAHSFNLLKLMKESTEKLREINRRVANIVMLENAVMSVAECSKDYANMLNRMQSSGNFTLNELQSLITYTSTIVYQMSFSLSMIEVVVTDNWAEMSDGERMSNMRETLSQLNNEIREVYEFMYEVEQLNSQRERVRSLQAITNFLGGSNKSMFDQHEYATFSD